MTQKKEPSAVVVPFGKHRGTTVAELLAKDPQYAEWLLAQGWLAERFAELHSAIMTRGAGTDDSPEHNAIQVRFLDPVFRVAFALASGQGDAMLDARCVVSQYISDDRKTAADNAKWRREHLGWHDGPAKMAAAIEEADRDVNAALAKYLTPISLRLVSAATFEHRGIDVVLGLAWQHDGDPVTDFELTSGHASGRYRFRLAIELKPSMGEDYPTVMRQMRRLGASCLVVGDYNGRTVPLPQLRQMFQANGQTVVLVRDIEAEVPNARAMIGGNPDA